MKVWRYLLLGLSGGSLAFLGFVLMFNSSVSPALAQKWASTMGRQYGLQIVIGEIRKGPGFTLDVGPLQVASLDGKASVVAEQVSLAFSPIQFFFGQIPISSIEVVKPQIKVRLEEGGKSEFPQWLEQIRHLRVIGGRVELVLGDAIIDIGSVDGSIKRQHSWKKGERQMGVELSVRDVSGRLAKPLWAVRDIGLNGVLTTHAKKSDVAFLGMTDVKQIEIDNVFFDRFSGQIAANALGLSIESGVAEIGGTQAQLSLAVNFDDHLSYALRTKTRNLSLYDLLYQIGERGSFVDLSIDAKVSGGGEFIPHFHFKGLAEGLATKLTVADRDNRRSQPKNLVVRTKEPVRFKGELYVDEGSFNFIDTELSDGISTARVECSLYLDDRSGMKLHAQFDHFDFRSIDNHIAGSSYSGFGKLEGFIDGTFSDLHIQTPIAIEDFVFDKLSFGNAVGELDFRNEKLKLQGMQFSKESSHYGGDFEIQFLDKGGIEVGLDIGVHDAQAQHLRAIIAPDEKDPILATLRQLDWQGPLQGKVVLRGPVKRYFLEKLQGNIDLHWTDGVSLFKEELLAGHVHINLDERLVTAKEIQLKTKAGIFAMRGEVDRVAKTINAHLNGTDIQIGQLQLPEVRSNKLSGIGSFNVDLAGDFDEVVGNGQLLAKEVSAGEFRFGDVNLLATLKSAKVIFAGSILGQSATLQGELSLAGSYPFSGQLVAERVAWNSVWRSPTLPPAVQIKSGAAIELSGNLADWKQSKGGVEFPGLQVAVGDVNFFSDDRLQATLHGGVFHVGQFKLRNERGDFVLFNGKVSPKQMDIRVEAQSGLWFLPQMSSHVLKSSGQLSLDVSLLGPWGKPAAYGVAKIENGHLALRTLGPNMDNLTAQIQFDGTRVELSSLRATLERGSVEAFGDIALVGISPSTYDLTLRCTNLPIRYADAMSTVVNGLLQLYGPNDRLLLSGNLRISDAMVGQEPDFDELFKGSLSSALGHPIGLNVRVVTHNPLLVRTNTITADVRGDLRVLGTSRKPGLRGSVVLLSGDAFVRGNRYQLQKGRLDFDDSYRIMPVVDLAVTTRIEDYDIQALVQGAMEKPKIILQSNPPLEEIDILGLIGFGFTRQEMKDLTNSAATASLEILSAYSGVFKRLVNFISDTEDKAASEVVKLGDFRLTSVFSRRQGVHLPAISMGADLVSGLKLRFQSSILDDGAGAFERRIELEQDLGRKVRWRIAWESNGDSNYGDAGADVWYRWEF